MAFSFTQITHAQKDIYRVTVHDGDVRYLIVFRDDQLALITKFSPYSYPSPFNRNTILSGTKKRDIPGSQKLRAFVQQCYDKRKPK